MNYPAPVLNETLESINKTIEQFVRDGVAYLTADYDGDYRNRIIMTQSFGLRKMLRIAARQMGRPYVIAKRVRWLPWGFENGKWTRSTESKTCYVVTIPRQKRLAPVFTPLLLVSKVKEGSRDTDPVLRSHDKTNYYFEFQGEVGERTFLYWLEQCRTEEPMRRALGTA